jgi:hypothetical protein
MVMFVMPRIGLSDEKSKTKPALRDCIEAVLLQSDVLISSVIDGLIAAKGMTQGRSAQISKVPANKAAVEHLRSNMQVVKATFATELRTALFHRGAPDTSVRSALKFDDFQFLDEAEIDANIELAQAEQEIAQAVDDALPQVNALISNLMGLVTVQTQLNPLRPEAFVHALRSTLGAHVKVDTIRRALLGPAASLMGVAMRQLYKDLTQWLRSQGVETALPVGTAPGAANISGVKPAESTVTRTLLTLDKLRRLLAGDFDSAPSTPGPRDFLHTVPFSLVALEDLKLVEPMMQRLAMRAKQNDAQEAKSGATFESSGMLANDSPQTKQLGRQLGGEVVRLMMENLLKDNRLLPKVRAMLKELEPVLLTLSQSDPRFFSERQHPARQLLDRMTHRSLAFTAENDEGFGQFFKEVSTGIQDLAGGAGDALSFTAVLGKLEARWQKDEDAQRKRHEESARALLHAEQRNLLAQRFADDFQKRVKDKDVPELINGFLRGPWSQVVAESQLSSTDGVADPDGFLSMVDDLIWSVQLRLARRNRSKLVNMVPSLLVKLRQGLQTINYPQERVPVLFDALITLHEKAFEGPRAAQQAAAEALAAAAAAAGLPPPEASGLIQDDDLSDLSEPQESDAEASWLGELEASQSGYAGSETAAELNFTDSSDLPTDALPGLWSVSDLKMGAWVELMLQGQWVRAQLTWASPHLTLFMFVSGRGLAHSMSRRTMDRQRALGLIRVVSDGDLVGNALDEVAQTALRNNPAV